MLKKFFTLSLILIMALSLVACGGNDDKNDSKDKTNKEDTNQDKKEEKVNPLIDKWVYYDGDNNYIYRFIDDTSGSINVMGMSFSFTYTIDDSKLTMTADLLDEEVVDTFTYKLDGDTLTLTNDEGEVMVLTRKGSNAVVDEDAPNDEEASDESTSDDSANFLLGKWRSWAEGHEMTFEFKSDYTGVMTVGFVDFDMTYEIDEDQIEVTVEYDGTITTDTYTYKFVDDSLILESDLEKIELTKID